MSFVEMGPVSSGVFEMIRTRTTSTKSAPSFVRDIPVRTRFTHEKARSIATKPLNMSEFQELDELRSLRGALESQSE